jgi:hypothetical protein
MGIWHRLPIQRWMQVLILVRFEISIRYGVTALFEILVQAVAELKGSIGYSWRQSCAIDMAGRYILEHTRLINLHHGRDRGSALLEAGFVYGEGVLRYSFDGRQCMASLHVSPEFQRPSCSRGPVVAVTTQQGPDSTTPDRTFKTLRKGNIT